MPPICCVNVSVFAVYIQTRKGKAVETREIKEGVAFADYGKKGELLGVEMLSPCELSVLDNIAKGDERVKQYIRSATPPAMLAAAG